MTLAALTTVPTEVAQAMEVIVGFDDCLRHGFARLGSEQRDALQQFVGTFAGSPLASSLADAFAAIDRSEFLVRNFALLAAGRVALQGAQYDSLSAQLSEVLNRENVEIEEPPPASAGPMAGLLGSTQQWLMELALTGFAQLEESSVGPFVATLSQLQTAPELTSLAAMATGFVNELLDHMPVERQPSLPVFRWGDLWAGLMLRCQQLPGSSVGDKTDGTLTPFGFDIRSHRNFVSATLYGLLTTKKESRTVRVPFTSYKVDVINGPEIWDLFGQNIQPILKALETEKVLDVTGAELLPSGDLILSSPPKVGKKADPFAAVADATSLPKLPALARHPVHLTEVVCTDDLESLSLATEQIAPHSELDEKTLSQAENMIGLLRFDQGGWRLQPLCVQTKTGVVLSGQNALQLVAKRKSTTLSILSERASKLLRE